MALQRLPWQVPVKNPFEQIKAQKFDILFHLIFSRLLFSVFRIIATLEKLKEEAAEITRKVEETDVVMAEVEAVSDQYGALSHYCSSIYFTMEGLNLVSQTANRQ